MTITITAPSGEILDAIKALEPAINPRPAVAILHGMKVDAYGGTVDLTAYDYSTVASRRFLADTTGDDGTFIIPAARTAHTIRALCARRRFDPVTITVDPDAKFATISANGYTAAVGVMPVEDYPTIPTELFGEPFRIESDALRRGVNRSVPAADGYLPLLETIRFTLGHETLILASTDRYRLARETIPVVGGSAADQEFLIRKRNLDAVLKVLRGTIDATVVADVADRRAARITLSDGVTHYVLTPFDYGANSYPKIDELFDKTTWSGIVERDDLIDQVRIAEALAGRFSALMLEHADGKVRVTYNDDDFGKSTAPGIPYATEGDAPATYWLKPAYFLAALRGVAAGPVRLSGTVSSGKPLVIQSGDPNDTYEHLVMPVRPANTFG